MARYQLVHAVAVTIGSIHQKLKAGTFCSDGVGAQAGDLILSAQQIANAAPGVFVVVGQTGDHPTGVDSVG